MYSARSGTTVCTFTKAPSAAVAAGWLSVTAILSMRPQPCSFCRASPAKTPCVEATEILRAPASLYAAAAPISDPPVRITLIIFISSGEEKRGERDVSNA